MRELRVGDRVKIYGGALIEGGGRNWVACAGCRGEVLSVNGSVVRIRPDLENNGDTKPGEVLMADRRQCRRLKPKAPAATGKVRRVWIHDKEVAEAIASNDSAPAWPNKWNDPAIDFRLFLEAQPLKERVMGELYTYRDMNNSSALVCSLVARIDALFSEAGE
ncbi:MAG: hypothetical protein ACXWPM_04385 [Bdellovibrionota bacterium]